MTNNNFNIDLLADAIEYTADKAGKIAKAEMELCQYAAAKMADDGASAGAALLYGASLMDIVGPHIHSVMKDNIAAKGAEMSDDNYIASFKKICEGQIDESFKRITLKRSNKAISDKENAMGVTRKM